MAWIRIDDMIAHHPKILRAGPVACWLFVAGLAYCARYRTEGFIPAEVVSTLTSSRNYRKLAERLVNATKPGGSAGLWEPVAGGYRVHDSCSCPGSFGPSLPTEGAGDLARRPGEQLVEVVEDVGQSSTEPLRRRQVTRDNSHLSRVTRTMTRDNRKKRLLVGVDPFSLASLAR
jgi:hypothetical protein